VSSEINLEQVEGIRTRLEQSLPNDIRSVLQQAGMSLTLGSSNVADAELVIVDPGLADELAEKELVEEMVSYRKDVTGIDHTVFISPKGHTRHSARIKLAIDPPDAVDPRGKTASIAIKDAEVMAGESVPPALLDQARRFINLNRDVLLEYWEYRIDTEQLRRRLRSIREGA